MRFLLHNASVYLHGEGFAPRSVLVEGRKIVKVSAEEISANAMPVDLTWYRLMPGFINTHVHLMDCFSGFDTQRLKKWLNAGVTHLRDQGVLSYRTAEGTVADLIAVKGDPIEFPYLLSNVQFVMKNGIAVKEG